MMRLRSLDPLELEVLTQFANGQSTDQISASLGRHKSVVQNLLRVAVRKLGAANRVHAVAIAVEMGLIKTTKRGL
jgi:DNA-binding CsgD family transcriptional regulator